MDTRYKNYTWKNLTEISEETFDSFDFSESNFNDVLFVNSTFTNCVFYKGKPGSLAFFGCDFIDCKFTQFDFRRISVGANGGTFKNTIFSRCDFSGREFEYPHFESCTFDRCKLKNINFNDASFKECRFVGKIEDTTFNGLYHKKPTGYTILDNVDFSEAVFGEFVTFEDCDLSTCIPPKGKEFADILYQIYKNNPKVLSTGSRDRIIIDQGHGMG